MQLPCSIARWPPSWLAVKRSPLHTAHGCPEPRAALLVPRRQLPRADVHLKRRMQQARRAERRVALLACEPRMQTSTTYSNSMRYLRIVQKKSQVYLPNTIYTHSLGHPRCRHLPIHILGPAVHHGHHRPELRPPDCVGFAHNKERWKCRASSRFRETVRA